MGFLRIVGIVALSLVGLVVTVGIVTFVAMVPDMTRYMRIKRM
jgi:hypothetical protein